MLVGVDRYMCLCQQYVGLISTKPPKNSPSLPSSNRPSTPKSWPWLPFQYEWNPLPPVPVAHPPWNAPLWSPERSWIFYDFLFSFRPPVNIHSKIDYIYTRVAKHHHHQKGTSPLGEFSQSANRQTPTDWRSPWEVLHTPWPSRHKSSASLPQAGLLAVGKVGRKQKGKGPTVVNKASFERRAEHWPLRLSWFSPFLFTSFDGFGALRSPKQSTKVPSPHSSLPLELWHHPTSWSGHRVFADLLPPVKLTSGHPASPTQSPTQLNQIQSQPNESLSKIRQAILFWVKWRQTVAKLVGCCSQFFLFVLSKSMPRKFWIWWAESSFSEANHPCAFVWSLAFIFHWSLEKGPRGCDRCVLPTATPKKVGTCN